MISAVPEAKALFTAEADFKSLAAGLLFLITVTLSQSVLLCIMVSMGEFDPGHVVNEVNEQAAMGIIGNSRNFHFKRTYFYLGISYCMQKLFR